MPYLQTLKIGNGKGIRALFRWLVITGAAACTSVSAQITILSTNMPDLQITAVAMSADGATIASFGTAVGGTNGVVCVSTNTGASWNSYSLPARARMSAAVSPDGSLIALGLLAIDGVLLSTNSGVTWTTNHSSTLIEPLEVAFSGDGTQLFAVCGQSFAVSTNRGLTWQQLPRFSGFLASDWTGRQLISIDENPAVALSTNGGESWFQNFGYSDSGYYSVTISADGTKLSASEEGYWIFVSTNSGANWSQSSITRGSWTDANAADGTRLIACTAYGVRGGPPYGVYTSTNCGLTWATNLALTNGGGPLAISQDGTRFCGALGTGGLFIALWPPNLKFQTAGTNLALSWPAPSTGWVLQQAVDVTANIWTSVAVTATVSNWEQQVILTNDTNAGFFRLAFTLP